MDITSKWPKMTLMPCLVTLMILTCFAATSRCYGRGESLVISGQITRGDVGVSGMTVTLSGSQSSVTSTDGGGNYSFANLSLGGTYTVTPSKDGATFTQSSKTFYNLSGSRTANFVQVIYYSIGGRITDASGASVANAVVTMSGSQSSTTTTDGNGNYAFAGLAMGGTYTVTPSKGETAFTQPSKTFYNLTGDRVVNFVQVPYYSLSGRITDGAYGVSGVKLTLAGTQTAEIATDTNGNFLFGNVRGGGSYSITPSKDGMAFIATSKSFFNLSANLVSNFSASINPQSVTGRIQKYTSVYVSQHFDSSSGMLYDVTGKPNVRDTMIAALLWSETGNMTLTERAVNAVLDSQVLSPDDAQYGNFPYYPGEVPIDRNWSAFIGSYLIVLRERHGGELSAELSARMLNAIKASAAHRLQVRRELHRTNIAILTAFVLIRAAELSNDPQLFQQGKTFWQNFVAFTDGGGIAEYNSPNYFKVDLYGLGFIADYINDVQVTTDAARIRRLFWWSVTNHYHSPTSQIAGPYSRAFTDRMVYEPTGIQAFLFRESQGQIPLFDDLPSSDDTALHAVLPLLVRRSWQQEWLQQALTAPQAPTQFREQTQGAASLQPGAYQQITTYLGTAFAVGSVNKDQIGVQQRPLIAHAKAADGADVGVFKLSVSGPTLTTFVMSLQERNSLLVVVSGDTYDVPAPVPMDIRLQWYGTGGHVPNFDGADRPAFGGNFNVQWMNKPVAVRLADNGAQNPGDTSLSWQETTDSSLLEVILKANLPDAPSYRGRNVYPALPLVFGIYFGDSDGVQPATLAPVTLAPSSDKSVINVSWASPNGLLEMQFPNTPGDWRIDQRINGQPLTAQPLMPPE